MGPTIEVLNHTKEITRTIAAAARLATTDSTGRDTFENSDGAEADGRLVRRLVSMGHLSVLEHASITLSIENGSVFLEQYMIQFRLASFTVKSRRYVDFGKSRYGVPDSVEQCGGTDLFREHMDGLFSLYREMCSAGIAKEDARFVLPYCFHSNFICTMNARELLHFLERSLFGPGSVYPEIRQAAERVLALLFDLAPAVAESLSDRRSRFRASNGEEAEQTPKPTDRSFGAYTEQELVQGKGSIRLISPNSCVEDLICQGIGLQLESEGAEVPDRRREHLLDLALVDPYRRHLEHALFTFEVRGVSLASLTHLTRHRIQSLAVPDLSRAPISSRYLVPTSIAHRPELVGMYEDAFRNSLALRKELLLMGMLRADSVYLNLAGNLVDVVTSMNLRELLHFITLRTCHRAQWEIRALAEELLEAVRPMAPYLLRNSGPMCVRSRSCPEGRMTCGKADEVRERYGVPSAERG